MCEGCRKYPSTTSLTNEISSKLGINPWNSLTFNFNAFVKLLWNFKAIPSNRSNSLNLNLDQFLSKSFFWSNHYIKYARIRVFTDPYPTVFCLYSTVFYCIIVDSVLMRENTGQWNSVFSHILCSQSLPNWSYDNFFHKKARVMKLLVKWSHLQYILDHLIKTC